MTNTIGPFPGRGAPCAKCGDRPGLHMWSEGAIAAIHGCYSWWCAICCLRARLDHAREIAATVPQLELDLARELSLDERRAVNAGATPSAKGVTESAHPLSSSSLPERTGS